jgi:hypothetical protein
MNKQNLNGKTIRIGTINDVIGETKYVNLSGENRKINEAHVKRLMESFSEFGTAALNITVIKSKAFTGKAEYYMADGQHSIIACNRLGLAYSVNIVEMVVDTPLNVTRYIATLNNNSKAWSNDNYLTAFAKNNLSDYKVISDIIEKTGLTITDILYIFLGNSGVKENKLFKNGEFKIVNEKDSMELLEATLMVKEHIPNKAFVRRSLYKVMRKAKNYKSFAKAIIKTSQALKMGYSKFSENEQEFQDHLERILVESKN